MNKFYVAIIGAGASGLFCWGSNQQEIQKLIIEKNLIPGKKLLLTGSGKCNFTNTEYRTKFIQAFGNNSAFLKFGLKAFDNNKCIEYFTNKGLKITIEDDGRVFPESQRASDVEVQYLFFIPSVNL
ncbi:MAG: NAD(P)/FAD-dependent oxidoreductase [Kosmotogaceae bacterium]